MLKLGFKRYSKLLVGNDKKQHNACSQTNYLPRAFVFIILSLMFLPTLLNLLHIEFTTSTLTSFFSFNAVNQAFHTGPFIFLLIEWSTCIIATILTCFAFLHYKISRNLVIPFISVGLLSSAIIGAYFGMLTLQINTTQTGFTPAIISFTWTENRIFHAMVLCIGMLYLAHKRITVPKSNTFITGISILAVILTAIIIHFSISLAQNQSFTLQMLQERPLDFIPLCLYLCTFVFICPRFYQNHQSAFTHALTLTIIIEILLQTHMTFGSSALFDNHFNIALYLKVLSYLTPLSGLMWDYYTIHKGLKMQQSQTQNVYHDHDILKHIDPDSKAYNRLGFELHFKRLVEASLKLNTPFMLGIIKFETNISNVQITECIILLKAHLRSTDTVAKIGRNEIAITLPGVEYTKTIKMTLDKVKQIIERIIHHEPIETQIHIGTACYPVSGATETSLLNKAKQGCFEAKQASQLWHIDSKK